MNINSNNISALDSIGKQMAVTANNVANVNTQNYEAKRAVLTEDTNNAIKVTISKASETYQTESTKQSGETLHTPPSDTDNPSNVALEKEISNSIIMEHGYTANAKMITESDKLAGTILNIME